MLPLRMEPLHSNFILIETLIKASIVLREKTDLGCLYRDAFFFSIIEHRVGEKVWPGMGFHERIIMSRLLAYAQRKWRLQYLCLGARAFLQLLVLFW